ncbi:hypothetical protein HAX54_013515 [Datura stramonium]|uniref:Putative plant transposon protein domain-containing protein n=1 Tax=Datura stramonium TaxID=4076 RepID=A0ABS8TLG8_DATST|nr:hypothetical protein [Datura stramonium]
MAPKLSKGKGVASSIHGSKRARRPSKEEHEDMSMAPPPLRRYDLHRILTLDLGLMFNASDDCNFNMVREFFTNWIPKERSNQVKIRGQIIEFAPKALNRLLGIPNIDPQPFVDMAKKPPYRNIRHTLCGPNSVARWTRHQQFGLTSERALAALCRVGPGYEEPLNDDVATEDAMARVDSDIESSDDDEEDSDMGEATLSPTDDEE